MLLIKNGLIFDNYSETFINADILIKAGKIGIISDQLEREQGCKVINAEGKVVLPGFVDPLTKIGCETGSNKESKKNEDFVNLTSKDINLEKAYEKEIANNQKLYKYGITTAGLSSGDANLVGANLIAYKTANADKPYAKNFARKASIAPMTGRVFYSNEAVRTSQQRAEALKKEIRDEKKQIFLAVDNKEEISAALEMEKELNLDLTLIGAFENRSLKSQIEQSSCKFILPDQTMFPYFAYRTDIEHYVQLASKGKIVAISYYNPIAIGAQSYLWSLANIVKNGASEGTALKMATENPAKLLGIYDTTGSIEVGKAADIVIWSENPLKSFKAKVEYAIIDGETIYENEVG